MADSVSEFKSPSPGTQDTKGGSEAKKNPYSEDETRLWKFINGVFSQLKKDCPIFGILVIGETGTGKSTLINNLLGRDIAPVGHTLDSETLSVTPHELSVEGVPIVVYDTPGLDDSRGDKDEEKHLKIMKSLLARGKIHLVIYCLKMTETRLRGVLIRTFKEYHKIGVPWEQTVITITFADKEEDTTGRFAQMQQHVKKALVDRVGVMPSIVERLKICPTAKDPNKALPNGRQWYVPFWLDVVEVLVPAALAQFLHIHKSNIHMESMPASSQPKLVNVTLAGEDQNRFRREVNRLSVLQTAELSAASGPTLDSETHLGTSRTDIWRTADVIKALNHQLDARWRELGTFLHVWPVIMDSINRETSNVDQCMLLLVEKWVCLQDGTGDLPRTWETVVQAVKDMGKGLLAEQLAEQHGVQLFRAAPSLDVARPPSPLEADIFNTADVIKALNHQLDAQWREFGTFLYVKPAVMDGISKERSNVASCLLQLVEKWLYYEDGTGDLPRTWKTVVQAVKSTGKGILAQQLAELQLSGQ